MIRSKFKLGWISLLSLASATACVSGSNSSLSTVVDALDGIRGSNAPVVDAYVQYLGPDSRWAGPVLWTIHVSARDGHAPVFEVTPELPKAKFNSAPELSNRVPASALGLTQGKTAPSSASNSRMLSLEQVRDRLQHLGAALASADPEAGACVAAVKVRLTRADGTVNEKQACRGSAVWTQVASELAAEFMGQSRYPAAQPAMTPPGAETAAPAAAEHAGKSS